MEAQERVTQARLRRGESQAAIDRALQLCESEADRDTGDLYLAVMARFVEELGGELHVAAVFPDETISLPSGSAETGGPSREAR